MRKIRFRAWDKFNKKMISSMSLEDIFYDGNCSYDGSNILSNDFNQYIFMQFTGLFDKNGKEIYEGDILEFNVCSETIDNIYITREIVSHSYYEIIPFSGIRNKCNWDGCCGCKCPIGEGIVIGNIYENPELIRGEK